MVSTNSKKQDGKMTDEHLDSLQELINYRFADRQLLVEALTHSSVAEDDQSYERLEFLGDAIAGFIIAEYLFNSHRRYSEGEMTQMKAATVNRKSMGQAGSRLQLEKYIMVDRGLSKNAELPPSLISDAYESLIGAIYLDGGIEPARLFILQTLQPELRKAETQTHTPNFKSLLQESLQKEGKDHPTYKTTRKTGPPHNRRFLVEVMIDGKSGGEGWGNTKKEAEQKAAKAAMDILYPDWQKGGIN
jgi:ribonuclease-3